MAGSFPFQFHLSKLCDEGGIQKPMVITIFFKKMGLYLRYCLRAILDYKQTKGNVTNYIGLISVFPVKIAEYFRKYYSCLKRKFGT